MVRMLEFAALFGLGVLVGVSSNRGGALLSAINRLERLLAPAPTAAQAALPPPPETPPRRSAPARSSAAPSAGAEDRKKKAALADAGEGRLEPESRESGEQDGWMRAIDQAVAVLGVYEDGDAKDKNTAAAGAAADESEEPSDDAR